MRNSPGLLAKYSAAARPGVASVIGSGVLASGADESLHFSPGLWPARPWRADRAGEARSTMWCIGQSTGRLDKGNHGPPKAAPPSFLALLPTLPDVSHRPYGQRLARKLGGAVKVFHIKDKPLLVFGCGCPILLSGNALLSPAGRLPSGGTGPAHVKEEYQQIRRNFSHHDRQRQT